MDRRAIGVFDSGVGGLTAVRELMELLPSEDIVYFGDTGRVPYGSRSRDIIRRYVREDIALLERFDVKLIVIACGTASAAIGDEPVDSRTPLITVLRPACDGAVRATRTHEIIVLGTLSTIGSGAYPAILRELDPDLVIHEQACPLFVPLAENGYYRRDNEVAQLVARDYLSHLRDTNTDTVILGCTHYPLLLDVIGDTLGTHVSLIDSGRETARVAAQYLTEHDMRTDNTGEGSARFYVSDTPALFTKTAADFLGRSVNGLVEQVVVGD